MKFSPRSLLELAGFLSLIGLLIWHTVAMANLKTQLANARTDARTALLRTQAAETSNQSCQAALGQYQLATEALSKATISAYASTDEALVRGSGRSSDVLKEVARLLSIRPPKGEDCEAAKGLARSAWKDGQ